MFVFHFVKHFIIDRRHNSHDQLMFYVDVERADAVVVNAAVNAAFFVTEAFAVAVENDNVKNDDFNKTII